MLDSNEWGKRLQDAILENAAIRDGLHDDEAQPLIDWGLALAVQVTNGLEKLPKAEAEIRYEELYGALPKLLTRITWFTLHRVNKGPEWANRTLEQLNELSRTLHGENAPQIPALLMSAYANSADGMATPAMVNTLMQHLTLVPPSVSLPPISLPSLF
jgi:hypothetical protein